MNAQSAKIWPVCATFITGKERNWNARIANILLNNNQHKDHSCNNATQKNGLFFDLNDIIFNMEKEMFYVCKFRQCGGCTFGNPDDLLKPTGASDEYQKSVHRRWCLQPPNRNPDLIACDQKEVLEVEADFYKPSEIAPKESSE
jgi:hypothetical protein